MAVLRKTIGRGKKDRREATRVSYQQPIVLRVSGGRSFKGYLGNVSLKGAYVGGVKIRFNHLPVRVHFSITLSGAKPYLAIKGLAQIVRQDSKKGVGLYFLKMNSDDLTRLRRLMELNFGKAEIILKELKYLSIKNKD